MLSLNLMLGEIAVRTKESPEFRIGRKIFGEMAQKYFINILTGVFGSMERCLPMWPERVGR